MTKYPSYIHVVKLKDLFWNNNSDLYPTTAPALGLYTRKNKTRPVFHNPYTATVVLEGDFNHAFYGGRYFFLSKVEVLDVERQKFKYQMDLDVVLNFMTVGSGGRVRGTIVRTNREEFLREAIQTAVPVISDPTDIYVFNTETKEGEEVEWQRNVVRLTDLEATIRNAGVGGFVEPSISVDDWVFFVQRVKTNYIGLKTKDKRWLPGTYSTVYYNPHQHTNPLLILDYLPHRLTTSSWKMEALGYLVSFLSKQLLWAEKQFHEEQTKDQKTVAAKLKETMRNLSNLWGVRSEVPLSTENYRKFVITKQNKVTGHFNDGGFAVSLENEAVGDSIEEGVYVERIDLSGLTDIVPLDNKGERKEPDVTPNIKKHLVTIPGGASAVDQYFYRLERKTYLPINSVYDSAETKRCIRTRVSDNFDLCSVSHIKNQPPQRVTFKETFRNRVGGSVGNLWYLNKNNFALVSYDGKLKDVNWTELPSAERDILRPYVELSNANVLSGYWYWWFFYNHKFNQLLPLGFMMYLIDRDPNTWRDFEYLGDQPLTQLSYLNNIKQSAVDRFENDRHNWRLDRFDTNNLLGLNEFQKYWLLELDRMTWLTLIPTQKGLNYKWMDTDEYGVWTYYPNATWNDWQYIARLPHMPIKKANETLKPPYGEGIDTYVGGRYAQVKEICHLGVFKPPNPINKGDIFTTSIEHELQEVDILYNLPFELTSEEKFDIVSHKYQFDQRRKSTVLPGGYVAPRVKPIPDDSPYYQRPLLGWLGVALGGFADYSKWQTAPLGDQVKYSAPTMDGFLHRRPVNVTTAFDTLILYLYGGEWRLGILEITPGQELRVNAEGILDSVEETKSTKVQIIQISNIDKGVVDYRVGEADRFNEGVQQRAFEEIMSRIRNSTNNRIFHYSSEDFKTLDLTFDLVGTDWYLLMVKGTVHLIPKPLTNLIREKPQDQKTKKIHVNIPESVDTFSKINQRSEFVVFGQSVPLNVKFPGGSESCLLYRQTELVPEGDDGMNYYNLWASTDADTIDTWITIPKKKTRAVENTDSTQSFIIREKLANLPLEYEQEKLRSRLFLDTKQELLARQREDLSWQREDAIFNLATKTTQIGGAAIAGLGSLVSRGSAGGLSAAVVGGAAVGAAANAAGSLYGSVQFLLRYPTLLERVNSDERNLILETTQQLFQRKQNYESNFAIQTLKLNKGVNSFIKPTISNRDVQEKSNKSRKIKDINVHLYLPNTSQRREIAHIYNTYGCECVYESDFLTITNDMEPILVKFSKIASGDMVSELTRDLNLRDILIQLFQNGVKFERVAHEAMPQEAEGDVTPYRKVDIVFDVENIPEWSAEKWDIFRVKRRKEEVIKAIRALDKYGLSSEEFKTYGAKIPADDDDKLLQYITRVIRGRTEGSVVEFPLPPELESIKWEDKLREKQVELDACNGEKEALNASIQTLNGEKAALEEELRQCKINIENLNQAKNTCDLISARKIKELEDKIKEKDIEIQAAQRGLAASVTRANTLSDQYKRLEEQKKQTENLVNLYKQETVTLKGDKAALKRRIAELEKRPSGDASSKDLEECRKEKELLEQQHRREKELLEDQKADIERQLRECLAKGHQQGGLNIAFNFCSLVKQLSHSARYFIDSKERDNGFSLFTDLCFELAQVIRWLRRTDAETYLGKYQEMQPVFEAIQDLERIPVIDTCMEVMGYRGWGGYVKYMLAGQPPWPYSEEIKAIVKVTTKIKDPETLSSHPSMHAVWDVLDEIFFLVYGAHTHLREKIKEDRDLENFFAHAFPGQRIKSLYEELFGIPTEVATTKKLMGGLQCPKDGEDQQETINQIGQYLVYVKHEQLPPTELPTSEIRPENPTLEDGYVLDGESIFPYINDTPTTAPLTGASAQTYKPQLPYTLVLPYPTTSSFRKDTPQQKSKALINGVYYPRMGLRLGVRSADGGYKTKYDEPILSSDGSVKGAFLYRVAVTQRPQVTVSAIQTVRNAIWNSRANIQLPREVEAAIETGSFHRQIAVRNWDLEFRKYKDEQINVDLVKLFGKEGAKDALILLGCLDAFKQWLEPQKTEDKTMYLLLTARTTAANFAEYLDPKQRPWAVIGENEFLDTRSVMNYIYRHIKQHPQNLLDTFKPIKPWLDTLFNLTTGS